MESTGLPGRIQISRETYERVHDIFEFEQREIEAKGKGKMKTYVLKEKYHQSTNQSAEKSEVTEVLCQRLEQISQNQTMNLFGKEQEATK